MGGPVDLHTHTTASDGTLPPEALVREAVRQGVRLEWQTGDEGWHVLQDPEGNQFCLLRRRLDPL